MGDLQDKLEEFQEQNKSKYADIMKVLEDNYCWKCPMRTTRTQSRCREVHAGRVIQEAMAQGITSHLIDSKIHEAELEAIILRILKKKINKQGGKQRETTLVFKVQPGQNPDMTPETYLLVKINPRRVKKGEKILIAPEPLENPMLGSIALITGFHFVTSYVKKTFHEGSFWYVEVENKRIIPLESIFGVLMKTVKEGNSPVVE